MTRSTSTDGKAPSGWRYGLPVALVAAIGIVVTAGLANWQRNQVDHRTYEVVAGSVTGASQRAAQSLGAMRGSMAAFRALFGLSPDVSDQQFSAFARETFRQRSDVETVVYAPARGGALPVEIIVPGGPGANYGLDLMGIPATAAAVEQARSTGQTTIVGHADNPLGGPPALLAYTAVYEAGGPLATSQQREKAFTGVVAAELQVSKWMQDAVDGMDATATSLALVDPATAQTLWTTADYPGGDTNAREVVALSEVQQYIVQGAPTSQVLASQDTWRPWVWLLVGLLITAIVTGLMWRWLDTRRIKRTADDLHEATKRLRFLAERDALTGIVHRDGLLAWLDDWDTRNPDRRLSALFIDLDGFKEVNTTWGHLTGDLVLRHLAHRLSVLADDRDSVVARVGGDHFVVMRALDRGSLDGLITTAQTLISEPIPVGDRDIRLSSSIGIAVRPEDGRTLDTLLMNADIAVRTAKEFVGDKVIRFDPVMAAEGAARRQLGRALRMAARTPADHFYLEYQPQVDMRTGRLVCAEALIRWRDGSPEGGQPGSFLPLATEFGLMPELGQWIIEEACRTVKQWRATCEAVIAVNVDTQQLTADFADVVSAALRQTGAEAGWLMVEVTEAAAMGPDAQRQLDRIRALGVAISIDDFGTGFSSLSRLTDLPAQQMKIDKAFVTGLGQSNETLEIVRTIVALAHTLGMQLLAEGVESTAQARVLIDEGVDIAQGFLFGRAMSADECLQMWHHGVALPLALSKK